MRTRLFIGGLEADLTDTPDILFTFQTDDVASPSAVKNSYSKSVTLVGSNRNNHIFDHFWFNDHRTTDGSFDPSKKTPFQIFMDSELIQEGYCKLDKVTTVGNLPSYSVSLFGGLGEFLYNLDQNSDGTKKTLADLNWFLTPESTGTTSFDFVINQDTVKTAWDELQSYSSRWSTLNFAPALQGIPQNFSADKCLMIQPVNPSDRFPITGITDEGVRYEPYTDGYVLAEMSRDRTADEMREFRSYLMRPVLRVQKAIENIVRPENCGDWKVNLDDQFFKYDNPWWAQAWVTLPSLTSLDYTAQETASAVTLSLGSATTGKTTTGWWSDDDTYYEVRPVTLGNTVADKVYTVNANIKLKANIPGATINAPVYPSAKYGRRTSQRTSHVNYLGSVFVQLVAYDAGGNAVAGSKLLNLTGRYESDPNTFSLNYPYGDTTFDTYKDGFLKESTGVYTWDRTLPLSVSKVPRGSTLKLWVIKANHGNGSADALLDDEDKGMWAYTGTSGSAYTPLDMDDFTVVVDGYSVSAERNESMRSNTEVKMEQLLKTSYSPADFLLAYCKAFGLYIVKDQTKREISILSRKSFFLRDQIVDIDHLIDRSNMETTPIVAKARWYKWEHVPSGEYADEYKKTYGKDYGEKDYATSYDFDNNTENVLKNDKVFKGAVQVLERGTDFWYTGDDTWKSWMYDGYKYVLYSTNNPGDTYEVNVPMATSVDVATHVPGKEYYDLFDKVQLHGANNNATGGEGVLLFFDRFVDLKAGTQSLKYYITDDNAKMAILNDGQPCWFWTNGEYDYGSNKVATRVYTAPKFSRMLASDAGFVLNSWDFGAPEETYVPAVTYREDSTLFNVFWESYCKDLYDRDTRIVKTKMLIDGKVTIDWLRRFYIFDNSIWRLEKISDCDITDRKMTTVEFVKVQDVANYDNVAPSIYGTINITFSGDIPATGGTVNFNVAVSDGGAWYLECPYDSDVIWSATAGTGNYTGTVTINSANASRTPREIAVYGYADPASCLVYLGQLAETATLNYLGTSYPGGSPSDHIPASGGTAYFELVTSTGWTANASTFSSVTPSSGTSGTTIIEAVMGPNTSAVTRTGRVYVTLSTGAQIQSGYITQDLPPSAYIQVSPSSRTSPASGETFDISVNASAPWTAVTNYSFITLSATSGSSGSSTITATVASNSSSQRNDTISFRFQDAPLQVVTSVYVTQEAEALHNKMWYKSQVAVTPNNASLIKDMNNRTCTISDSVMVSQGEYAPHWEFEFANNLVPEELGEGAFSGNTNLTGFRWYGGENKYTLIKEGCFKNCTNLQSLEIYGDDYGSAGKYVVSGCTALTSLTFTCTTGYSLSEYAFAYAPNLKTADVTIPGNYIPATGNQFDGCDELESVIYRPSGSGTTATLKLPNYSIPMFFSNLPKLKTVDLTKFSNISGAGFNIQNCPNLTDIYWSGTVSNAQVCFVTSRFSGCPAITVHCSDGNYTIPSTL